MSKYHFQVLQMPMLCLIFYAILPYELMSGKIIFGYFSVFIFLTKTGKLSKAMKEKAKRAACT